MPLQKFLPYRDVGIYFYVIFLFDFQDTGIGMTREEMVKNLGTIAHSGSKV